MDGLEKLGTGLTELFNQAKSPLMLDMVNMYSKGTFYQRDILNCNKIIETFPTLSEVTIVGGNLPLTYIYLLSSHFKHIKIKVVEDTEAIFICSSILTDFNVQLHKKDILFDDITDLVTNVDLVIFPETETLAPFNMLNYKVNTNMFCSNMSIYDYKHNNNQSINEDELVELCGLTEVVDKGCFHLTTSGLKRRSFYVIGR